MNWDINSEMEDGGKRWGKRKIHGCICGWMEWKERKKGRQVGRRQIDRLIDRWIDRQAGRQENRQRKYMVDY